MQHEIELKLAVAPEHMNRWRRTVIVRRYAAGRSSHKKLVSTYFDTPDLRLQAMGVALRVRRVGSKRIQTLKVPSNNATGFQHVIEYEQEIHQDEADLSLIASKPLQKRFAKHKVGERLTALFTTEISRRITILRYGDCEIEMALDEGRILAGEKSMPLSEVEFELRSGEARGILDLALELHGELPFTLERRSKVERGYALFTGKEPSPAKAASVSLSAKSSTREIFSRIAWNCVDQIRDNELPVLTTDDPEGVHQLRVGIRRLRSLFVLYRPFLAGEAYETVVSELAWAQKELGPARDWDVFVLETLTPVQVGMPEEQSLSHLAKLAAERRTAGSGDAKAFVRSERYLLLMLRLFKGLELGNFLAEEDKAVRKRLEKPVRDFAAEVLSRHDRRVRKLASRVAELEIEDIHRLRLRVKKMRYAAEFFKSIFPDKKAKRRGKALAGLQEALGAVNDVAVCEQLLTELTAASPRSAQLKVASGVMRGWYSALSAESIASLATLWRDYEATPCFWEK